MKIDVLVDVYPHPFKPYLDIQFEEWLKQGHLVRVFSAAAIPGATSSVPVVIIKTLREQPLPIFLKVLARAVLSPQRSLAVLTATSRLQKVKALAIDCQMPEDLPDLFFIHNLAAGARFAYLKALKVPIALYYHGGEIPGVPQVTSDKVASAVDAATLIFSNTTYSVDDICRRGAAREKVKKVPVGFRLRDFDEYREKHYQTDGIFRLVSVGRVALEKGFDVAVRAVAELKKAATYQMVYTIIGDGPEIRSLKSLIDSLGLNNHVRLLGKLPNRSAIEHMANADILLLPSIPGNTAEENQACVMQEAMMTGLAVVASKIGGVPESLPTEMREYLFEPGHHESLADSLNRLFNKGKREIQELGKIGRSYVTVNYDIEKINRKLLSNFEGGQSASPQGD